MKNVSKWALWMAVGTVAATGLAGCGGAKDETANEVGNTATESNAMNNTAVSNNVKNSVKVPTPNMAKTP